MVRGKKADKAVQELEEQKKKVKLENLEVSNDTIDDIVEEVPEEEEMSESFKNLLNDFREDGGWVHVKRKKDGKIEKIGKYRPADFDKDEIAKEFGGGTYFYVLRDNNGAIRARSEETYIDKKEPEKSSSSEFMQMAQIIKEQTKEIENLKAELLKPKQDDQSQNMIIEMMKENQRNQVEMLKAIASQNSHQVQQPTSMTEMLTAITTIMTLINKNQPQKQEVQQENKIGDLVELAGLFADMKASGEPPKQETVMDIIKTFLTDGSLGNIIAMLKAPKPPMVQAPRQQVQQVQQQTQQLPQAQQVAQESVNNDKVIVQEFFKQYQKQLFQLKVDGGNGEYIANTIIPFFDLNNDFKTIGYNYFKDVNTAFNGLMEVAVEFKNEQTLLKEIVEHIHNYFGYNEQSDNGGEQDGNEN